MCCNRFPLCVLHVSGKGERPVCLLAALRHATVFMQDACHRTCISRHSRLVTQPLKASVVLQLHGVPLPDGSVCESHRLVMHSHHSTSITCSTRRGCQLRGQTNCEQHIPLHDLVSEYCDIASRDCTLHKMSKGSCNVCAGCCRDNRDVPELTMSGNSAAFEVKTSQIA